MPEPDLAGACPARQDLWRQKLAQAEVGYAEAVAGLDNAVARNDGVAAAMTRKRAAREEFLRLLHIFADLVMRGKAPPESDSPVQTR